MLPEYTTRLYIQEVDYATIHQEQIRRKGIIRHRLQLWDRLYTDTGYFTSPTYIPAVSRTDIPVSEKSRDIEEQARTSGRVHAGKKSGRYISRRDSKSCRR